MNTIPAPTAMTTTAAPTFPRPLGYHGAVSDFKRRLIEATLLQMRGNRTHTARALGLQRTYLTVGVERQGIRLTLSHITDGEWRATFMENEKWAPRGFGVAPTPWGAVQMAALAAVNRQAPRAE